MAAESNFRGLFGIEEPRSQGTAKAVDAKESDSEEARCPAFTYLRAPHERAAQVEFRLRNGNCEYFPYSLLAPWRYNPSFGIMLKFTGGDLVTVVLIRGSNLDALVNDTVNLTDRGFQRHRIVSIREMDEDELQRAEEGVPTVDAIDVVEFESNEMLQDYLKQHAPGFARDHKAYTGRID